jgi:serine/threonine-protein kinase RsbT
MTTAQEAAPGAGRRVCRIATEADLVFARRVGRDLAQEVGLSLTDQALLAAAISELARNILSYAGEGRMHLAVLEPSSRGVEVIAVDEGPGIADLDLALQDGYSTGGGLGLGLPGTRRISDEFEIRSKPGQGVWVRIAKRTLR